MRKLIASTLAAASLATTALFAGPASANGGPAAKPTIAGIVAASAKDNGGRDFDRNGRDFDILLEAVKTAGLVDALNDPKASLTVFAPDDNAFIRTARDLGFTGWDEQGAWDAIAGTLTTLGGGDPVGPLTKVLTYHVAPGRLGPLEVLITGSTKGISTLEGESIRVDFLRLVDKSPTPDAYLNIFALNVQAQNGVIHGITRVLLPTLP